MALGEIHPLKAIQLTTLDSERGVYPQPGATYEWPAFTCQGYAWFVGILDAPAAINDGTTNCPFVVEQGTELDVPPYDHWTVTNTILINPNVTPPGPVQQFKIAITGQMIRFSITNDDDTWPLHLYFHAYLRND